jgi:hypothetical protein
MSEINLPAFPEEFGCEPGMELRDYFAAKAMQGILSGNYPICYSNPAEDHIAKAAYEQADAMLKARQP